MCVVSRHLGVLNWLCVSLLAFVRQGQLDSTLISLSILTLCANDCWTDSLTLSLSLSLSLSPSLPSGEFTQESTGRLYKGGFKDGRFHGDGELLWFSDKDSRKKYIGEFRNGQMNGHGEMK